MPYRRLPNTDASRLKALKTSLERGEITPPIKLAYSQSLLQRLKQFCPQFEGMIFQQRSALNAQVSKSKNYSSSVRKVRLYISHFFQVLNLAILRGDLPSTARKFYGLKETDSKIPALNTENDIVFWSEKIIKGEAERIASGGNPMTNPTAALVRVRYEQFLEAQRFQKTLQKATNYASNKISTLRTEADNLILQLWNEIESTYDLLPDEEKRGRCARYGVVYVFRSGEKEDSAEPGTFVTEAQIMSETTLAEERQKVLEGMVYHDQKGKAERDELQYSLFFSK
jgi:hypothetical protein